MAPARPDFRWASKIRVAVIFCLVGAVAGTSLYFGNLAYIRAGDEAAAAVSRLAVPSMLAGTCLTARAAPLTLVIGARSNAPDPTLPGLVHSLLETAASSGQQISIVRIDGQPRVFPLQPFTTTAANAAARQYDVTQYLNRVTDILNGEIRAQVAQADVLTALELAGADTGPNGNIILVDSGLQTVGALNYRQPGLLAASPGDIVAFLRSENLLPDLSGRHVLLSGIGYTAAPQPPFPEILRNNLVSQWEAIVTAAGGCVTADLTPNIAPEIHGLPPVGIVPVPAPLVVRTCGTIVLEDEGDVGFVAGTAIFRDPAYAEATLAQLASTLKKGTAHITLIGSTSSEGSNAENYSLSLERAEAVRSLLISLGIAASRITTVGDGSHWPGRVPDIGPGGTLLPAQAEQDREVIVQLPQCSS
jgi:outer membrane protein OmpA-like peptidoglycan-associated protein